jgi:exodeoxyribonuclease VIII
MPPAATSAPLELRPLKKEPGVYPGMSFEEYTRIDAINFSVLSLFKDTAAHARFGLLKEDVPTPAQALGHAVHAAILEPERFARDFAVAPKVDRRTTPGKKAWRNFEAANLGKELVTYDQMTTCRGLLRSVSQHASAIRSSSSSGSTRSTRSSASPGSIEPGCSAAGPASST